MFKRLFAFIFKSKRPTEHNNVAAVTKGSEASAATPETPPHIQAPYGAAKSVSRRTTDMNAESELARFLDENLYAKLLAEGNFCSIERMTEKEQQLQGIDVVVKTQSSVGYIDEKAQLYYINKDIPTFAFELQFLKNGQVIEGWFLNDDLKTDHYLLIWPFASVTDVTMLKKEDFIKLDALMVSKKKLRETLASLGFDKATLVQKAAELRRTRTYGKVPTGTQGIYYYASDSSKYVEAPINIVISKARLIALADARYVITKDGFRRQNQNFNI